MRRTLRGERGEFSKLTYKVTFLLYFIFLNTFSLFSLPLHEWKGEGHISGTRASSWKHVAKNCRKSIGSLKGRGRKYQGEEMTHKGGALEINI